MLIRAVYLEHIVLGDREKLPYWLLLQPIPFELPFVVEKEPRKFACFSCSPLQCVPVSSSRLIRYVCNSYFSLHALLKVSAV